MRECYALIDHQSDYCIMPAVDAFRLGYAEAAKGTEPTPNLLRVITSIVLSDAPLIKVAEVAMGPLVTKDVEFLAFDLYQEGRCDVVLGRNLLRDFRITIDSPGKRMQIQMERVEGLRESS